LSANDDEGMQEAAAILRHYSRIVRFLPPQREVVVHDDRMRGEMRRRVICHTAGLLIASSGAASRVARGRRHMPRRSLTTGSTRGRQDEPTTESARRRATTSRIDESRPSTTDGERAEASDTRRGGARKGARKAAAGARKAGARKTAARKTSARSAGKTSAAKKTAAKKSTAKKSAGRKSAGASKPGARKAASAKKSAPARAAGSRKSAASKTAGSRKTTASKAAVKKPAAAATPRSNPSVRSSRASKPAAASAPAAAVALPLEDELDDTTDDLQIDDADLDLPDGDDLAGDLDEDV
jgi:hypothetical protein